MLAIAADNGSTAPRPPSAAEAVNILPVVPDSGTPLPITSSPSLPISCNLPSPIKLFLFADVGSNALDCLNNCFGVNTESPAATVPAFDIVNKSA